MKKTFKFFAAALAIVAAASCAKEINLPADENKNEEPKVYMTFSASIDPEAETKTALNGKLVEWNVGDMIAIWGTGSSDITNMKGVCTVDPDSISEDKSHASFSGEVVPTSKMCAVYPAEGWRGVDAENNNKFQFSGLALQNAVEGSFDPTKHLMLSTTAIDNNRFEFKNVCALAKVTVGFDGAYSIKVEGKALDGSSIYGSIGGPIAWRFNRSASTFQHVGVYDNANKKDYIILADANGSALKKGATYYVVLPACGIREYSVSICGKDGGIMSQKSKTSDFEVERNKIYDMGAFEIEDLLEVNKSSLSLGSISASDNISITANSNWKITSNVSWITFDVSSGAAGSNIQVRINAANNDANQSRSAVLTITAGTKTATVNVVQSEPRYKIINRWNALQYAGSLKNNAQYVIFYAETQDHTRESAFCWTVDSEGKLVKKSLTDKNAMVGMEYVFTFEAGASLNSWQSYGSFIQGYLRAPAYGNYYLSETLSFNAAYAAYAQQMVFANHWVNESTTRCDIDIWKSNDDSKTICNDGNGKIKWGGDGDQPRKYFFYEVERY